MHPTNVVCWLPTIRKWSTWHLYFATLLMFLPTTAVFEHWPCIDWSIQSGSCTRISSSVNWRAASPLAASSMLHPGATRRNDPENNFRKIVSSSTNSTLRLSGNLAGSVDSMLSWSVAGVESLRGPSRSIYFYPRHPQCPVAERPSSAQNEYPRKFRLHCHTT